MSNSTLEALTIFAVCAALLLVGLLLWAEHERVRAVGIAAEAVENGMIVVNAAHTLRRERIEWHWPAAPAYSHSRVQVRIRADLGKLTEAMAKLLAATRSKRVI